MYTRLLQNTVEKWLFKGKIIIIYGPRQAGKTTLAKQILDKYGKDGLYLNCEFPSSQEQLRKAEPAILKSFFGDKKIVVLDEAQSIQNIGRVLKTFIDTYKDIQIIATGSSSFDLANKINEPLTGRSIEFTLLPLSMKEIINNDGMPDFRANEENVFRFGSYPGVYNKKDSQEAMKMELENIESGYLYKDILSFDEIRKPTILKDILKLLAFQVGSEVSLNEIAQKLEISTETVDKYIDLLEKCFIVKRLSAFSRNLRNEIKKNFKVYFIDIGIRNSIIQNYNPLELRKNDTGPMFENIFLMEKMKKDSYLKDFKNYYFWRTYDKKEIDLIEEYGGQLHAFECKYSDTKKMSEATKRTFLETYPNSEINIVTKNNYIDFLL
jgi:uncharacterized protein